MNELKDKGKLACTPSKSYDDRVILESAVRLDAAVVSNDHYRELNDKTLLNLFNNSSVLYLGDLMNEKPEFREVISRLIRYNWMFQQLIFPEDPHGRNGPKLNDILYRKS